MEAQIRAVSLIVLYIFFHFSVHDDFKSVIHECYAPYSPGVEDEDPFGLKNGTA